MASPRASSRRLPPRIRNSTPVRYAMEDERKKYLDYLLADFTSIKEEIRRRSTLQRFVLLGFATVLAFTFREAASNKLSAYWITGLWVSSFLALLFYSREGLEIGRLGTVIRDRLALPAAREFHVRWKDVFPSETNPGMASIDPVTALYDVLFNWIVFLGLPALITIKFIAPVCSDLSAKLCEHPWEALLSSLAALGCIILLPLWRGVMTVQSDFFGLPTGYGAIFSILWRGAMNLLLILLIGGTILQEIYS